MTRSRMRLAVVALFDLEIGLEQIDDRAVGGGLSVRDRTRFQNQRTVHAVGMSEFVEQARLAHARLSHHRDDLAMSRLCSLQCSTELRQLRAPADEPGQASHCCRLKPGARRTRTGELIDLHRLGHAFDRHRAPSLERHEAFDQLERRRGHQGAAGRSQLLHAGSQMGGLPHGGVIHVQIAADRTYDHLARIESNPYPDRQTVRALRLLAVSVDGRLHGQRRIACAHRMILERERCAEQRHDAVAHHLVDRALVAVHRLHHPFEHGIQQLARFLRVAIGQQLHRTLQIGEQHRDLLALAFQRLLGQENALGQMLRCVGVGRAEALRRRRCRRERLAAALAEGVAGSIRCIAVLADRTQRQAALWAKPCIRREVALAAGALHARILIPGRQVRAPSVVA